jgi:hypothetical protein
LIEIINKHLLLQLVGYLCYWQMGFNSVFKGLKHKVAHAKVTAGGEMSFFSLTKKMGFHRICKGTNCPQDAQETGRRL